ncbi:hypothetical protein [Bradyrhizobium sp. CCBAU 45384]|uniref:hypothetical protein n=1 Tax=Bradyrhizobium sp. CCBAU 45384 TaxID=858428 RepID=UPI0023066BEA|nr:hypothetical protein [Bradyrhizobium sp. CCBAU 45384]
MIGLPRLSAIRPLTVVLTALPVATLLLSPDACFGSVHLRQVDGGTDYYSQFSNSLPSVPAYFPIGVWFQRAVSQNDIDQDKDASINLYVVLSTDSNLALVERNGMHAILQQSDWGKNPIAINSPAVVGWELSDEIDMREGAERGYSALSSIAAQTPNDGRMRYNNYGKGVMFWETDPEAARFVNFQHVASSDVYWFTDPHLATSQSVPWLNNAASLTATQVRRAANYGYTVDRMRALNEMGGLRRPIWNFIEVGWPYTETAKQGGRAIAPAQVRAAVWHSIIAGARGIIYFNHSFSGPHPSQHALRDPPYAAVRTIVRSTNQLITQLAPVLNAPFADGFATADASIRTMTKFHQDTYFIFAGSKQNSASTPTISLTSFGSGTATVIGENRTIPIAHGRFSDSFEDGNAIHIYRIDGDRMEERP